MIQRVVTGVVLASLLIAGVHFLPAPGLLLALGALITGGFWEWSAFAGWRRPLARAVFTLAGALLLWLVYFAAFKGPIPVQALLTAAALWWIFAFIMVLRYPIKVSRGLAHAAAVLTLLPAWLGLAALSARTPSGPLWLLAAFAMVFAADTGAYFAGRALGRHKLAPAVSPGKTWEGVLGGAALAAVVAAGFAGPLGMPRAPFAAAAVAMAFASVVGDLTLSLFKRNAGLKDSGRLFPGHGGILDRIDSVCAAAPLLALGLSLIESA